MGFFPPTTWNKTKEPLPLVAQCGKCQLFKGCKSPYMPVDGKGRRKVLIVCEGPGYNEDQMGRPLVGIAGSELSSILWDLGIDMRQDCWMTNAIICRASDAKGRNRKPTSDEINYCRPNLLKVIEDLKPNVIIPLGMPAIQSIMSYAWKDSAGEYSQDSVARWAGWDIPSIKLNAWICHTAGVMVTTTKGLVAIESVKIGDLALTHTGTWKPVIDTIKREYEGELLLIRRAHFSIPLEVTPEHPLFVNRSGTPEWIVAKDIVPGDYLLEPIVQSPYSDGVVDGRVIWTYIRPGTRPSGQIVKGKQSVKATKHAMRLLGYYLAEGYKHGRGLAGFAFHRKEKKFQEEVIESYNKTFNTGNPTRVLSLKNNKVAALLCPGVATLAFLQTTGSHSWNKKFPDWVWNCSKPLQQEMLRALWNGDGWMTDDGSFGIQLVSRQLIEDIRRLLLSFDIISNVRVRYDRKGTFANAKPAWELTVKGRWIDKLAVVLGRPIPAGPKRRMRLNVMSMDGYAHYRVESISTTLVDTEVYNIEVDDDHSYLADGVISHNCPSYHPSFLSRLKKPDGSSKNAAGELIVKEHLAQAFSHQNRPWDDGKPDYAKQVRIILDPEQIINEIGLFRQAGRPVAFDFENSPLKCHRDDSYIICASISDGDDSIAFPWSNAIKPAFKAFVQDDQPKIAANIQHEEQWCWRHLGCGVKNWLWCTMLGAHWRNCTHGICGLKFQAFVLNGVEFYGEIIDQLVEKKGDEGTNTHNRLREAELRDVLIYCGLDSLYEVMVARKQMNPYE